jgi:hypothetical protein
VHIAGIIRPRIERMPCIVIDEKYRAKNKTIPIFISSEG